MIVLKAFIDEVHQLILCFPYKELWLALGMKVCVYPMLSWFKSFYLNSSETTFGLVHKPYFFNQERALLGRVNRGCIFVKTYMVV